MDKQRRKELVEEYRNIKTLMGVIKITNAANGKIFIAGFPNLKNKWFTIGFQLDAGRHPNSGLQSDWKTFSREAFHYEVLEEIPVVRKDFGYIPLVTPTSQIVGTQAVMNIIAGERYKMVPKESKMLLKGEYGKVPGEINTDVQKKCLTEEELNNCITCRPADLLEPEFEKYKAAYGELCRSDEDVLSCALFPQVAPKFLRWRNDPDHNEPPAPPLGAQNPPAAATGQSAFPGGVRLLTVEDLSI